MNKQSRLLAELDNIYRYFKVAVENADTDRQADKMKLYTTVTGTIVGILTQIKETLTSLETELDTTDEPICSHIKTLDKIRDILKQLNW